MVVRVSVLSLLLAYCAQQGEQCTAVVVAVVLPSFHALQRRDDSFIVFTEIPISLT